MMLLPSGFGVRRNGVGEKDRGTLRLQMILSMAVSGLLDAGLVPSAVRASTEAACRTWAKEFAEREVQLADKPQG